MKPDHALVSVMIPTYNHEHFIAECLDSILTQDYPALEIVVSDDASQDSTPAILREYASRHPNIKVLLNERNLGVNGNCNRALAACTGEYVALFAGDDVMLPAKISTQIRFMEDQPDVVLSYHDVEVFDSGSGRVLYTWFKDAPGKFQRHEGDAGVLVEHGAFCCGCSIMIRREAAPASGYDSAIPIASDLFFWIEVAVRGRVAGIEGLFARYRKHAAGLTNRNVGRDEALTLDLVDERYPQYQLVSRRRRRVRFHRLAAKAALQGEFGVARRYATDYMRALRPLALLRWTSRE